MGIPTKKNFRTGHSGPFCVTGVRAVLAGQAGPAPGAGGPPQQPGGKVGGALDRSSLWGYEENSSSIGANAGYIFSAIPST